MAISYVKIRGHIKDGKLAVELPENVVDGEVEVTLPVQDAEVWTDAEIQEFMTFKPVPANQLKTGGWEGMDIEDSAEWVEELRRKEEERQGW